MRRYLVLLFLSLVGVVNASPDNEGTTAENCLQIHHDYLKLAYRLTKNCVGMTAPISGRAYGYFAVGMYESTVDMPFSGRSSLDGVLNGFKRINLRTEPQNLRPELVANTVDFLLLKHFYQNAPSAYLSDLEALHDSIAEEYGKCKKRIRKLSHSYAEQITRDIIAWSEMDGAKKQMASIYDQSGDKPTCESCWEPTFPGYLPPMLPSWGEIRPMLKNSRAVTDPMPIFEFSTDSTSFMFNEAQMVWENGLIEDPELETIAEYWDDGTGRSGTPAGHYFSIARQLVEQKNYGLDDAVLLYARLGVAINDAFIASFHLKYQFYFIRPITYIHQYIDPRFNTRIDTPPFPEYPSGHSFQAGAASEVMKSVFGDSVSFVDATHQGRTDINGSPRAYGSLTEMSEEISLSRFYGGIHFKETLDRSLVEGRKIGKFVSQAF